MSGTDLDDIGGWLETCVLSRTLTKDEHDALFIKLAYWRRRHESAVVQRISGLLGQALEAKGPEDSLTKHQISVDDGNRPGL